eukprot:COSAG01_NODE_935_length_12642_cov_37.069361_8_plen_75_part_00
MVQMRGECLKHGVQRRRGAARVGSTTISATWYSVLCLGAGSVTRTHYEINLDQRILDPEICMHACMAGRPAGLR